MCVVRDSSPSDVDTTARPVGAVRGEVLRCRSAGFLRHRPRLRGTNQHNSQLVSRLYKSLFTDNLVATEKHSSTGMNTNKIRALEVFLNDMRYINPRFTYLLTYKIRYKIQRSSPSQ